MRLQTVSITARPAPLAALRYLPEPPARPIAIVYSHGLTAGKYGMDNMASYLAQKGHEGLTFDFCGHKLGATGGRMSSVQDAVSNVSAAARWLEQSAAQARVVLVGHSMGGVASLAAAAMGAGKRLAGVAAICVGEQPSRGFESAVGGAMLKLRRDYVDGAPLEKLLSESDTLLDSLRSLAPLPVLMIAAQQDVLVPVERVQALAARIAPHGALQIVESSHLEAPDRSRTALLKWLETLES